MVCSVRLCAVVLQGILLSVAFGRTIYGLCRKDPVQQFAPVTERSYDLLSQSAPVWASTQGLLLRCRIPFFLPSRAHRRYFAAINVQLYGFPRVRLLCVNIPLVLFVRTMIVVIHHSCTDVSCPT